MGLVNELQESAERDDVLTVLRKAKRLSAKLGLSDITDWLNHEQNGYPQDVAVPNYRDVRVTFYYDTNGYIPAGYGMLKSGRCPMPWVDMHLTFPVKDSIGTVMSWISHIAAGKGSLFQQLTGQQSEILRGTIQCNFPEILDQLVFMCRLDDSQIQNIPEQVKNRVLDWACKLESANITGDGQSFSVAEKQVAQSMVFNISNGTVHKSSTIRIGGAVVGGIQVDNVNSTQQVDTAGDESVPKAISEMESFVRASGLDDLDKDDVLNHLIRIQNLVLKTPSAKSKQKIQEHLAAMNKIVSVDNKLAKLCKPHMLMIHNFEI